MGIEAGKSFKCDERPPEHDEVGVVKVSAVTWGTFDELASKTCTEPERIDDRFFIRPGDFLFSRANTIQLVGACVIVHDTSRRLMLSDKILRFRFRDVIPAWILYVLRSEWGRSEIERLATGNQESMRNIGQERISAIRVPIPPLGEQRRIVAEIESQLTRLDAAVAALHLARRRLVRYRAAVSKTCFRPAIVTGKSVPLGELGEVVGGVARGQKRPRSSTVREVPYLRVANVQRGYLDLREVKRIEATEEEISTLALREGDILLNEGGDRDKLGRGWVWRGELPQCIHQNHVFRVRLNPDLALPEYVSWYANSMGRQYFFQEGKHTTNLASISLTKLRAFPVPVVSLIEQERVVSELGRQLSMADALDRACEANIRRAERLRQAILKRAFEGRLVPQDPKEEPASEILARLQSGGPNGGAGEVNGRKSKVATRPRR